VFVTPRKLVPIPNLINLVHPHTHHFSALFKIVTYQTHLEASPETRTRGTTRSIARSVLRVVRAMPTARQKIAKHIPAEANARTNRTSTARQWRGKQALQTIQVVFSMVPPRNYISSSVVNHKSVAERGQE
jgi:hypothetical protein